MRYLIQDILYEQREERREYVYDSMRLWTVLSGKKDRFVEYSGFPFGYTSVFFITGHNYMVYEYLIKNKELIKEKLIVIITCKKDYKFNFLKTKANRIFISKQNAEGYSEIVYGDQFKLGFDLTESEVIFYNSAKTKNIKESVVDSFEEIYFNN